MATFAPARGIQADRGSAGQREPNRVRDALPVDLQLLTLVRFLRPLLASLRGRVLDVGAGEAPWREWMTGAEYVGLDVERADEFGMKRQDDVIYYGGGTFPFADGSFDHVLSVEVIEHVPDPAAIPFGGHARAAERRNAHPYRAVVGQASSPAARLLAVYPFALVRCSLPAATRRSKWRSAVTTWP